MRYKKLWIVAILIIATLQLAACTAQTQESSASESAARVERIGNTDFSRILLTAQAAKRLGIETAHVYNVKVQGKLRKVVPYTAVFYDLNGKTWVYTNPEPLTFIRAQISVDSIDGDMAVLLNGPPTDTVIVTVGSPELYGTEFGVGQ